MNNLRLLLAFSSIIVFFGCVENEIERYEVQISVEPQGSASISPEIYGPLFPGDSLSITITPVDGFAFDQWSGTINSFEETITIFGTQDHQLNATLNDVSHLPEEVQVYKKSQFDPHPIFAVHLGAGRSGPTL
ncbi:MAG: hypothetical protein ACPHOD_00650 [Flavobacteriaceae bacterium]